MDFMKWISSLDELLYEVMSWLLFLPLTLWRTISRPLSTMRYAERQLALPEAEQYASALSPPLFLALLLLITHSISAALGETDAIMANRHGLAGLVNDNASALILRLIVFAAFPIFAAARQIRMERKPLDRTTLRLPFYAQCYPTAILALGLGLATEVAGLTWRPASVFALPLTIASLGYYVVVETRWFMAKLGIGALKAFGAVMAGLLEGFILLLVVGFLFTR
jgi:hypothetical protein